MRKKNFLKDRKSDRALQHHSLVYWFTLLLGRILSQFRYVVLLFVTKQTTRSQLTLTEDKLYL